MSFLERIRPAKVCEAAALRESFSARPPERPGPPPRGFARALAGGERLIAELKRKSPSDPEFAQGASFPGLARVYERSGAAAISIVVDEEHFGSSLADVAGVRAAADLPVIVKDFVLDDAQIDAAWAAGADAVLLIARFVPADDLKRLLDHAHGRGLDALVECHDQADIDAALAGGARLVGLNNRDLARLTTDLALSERFLPRLPAGVVKVCESGIGGRAEIEHLAGLGADAFLVGHAILKDPDPGRRIRRLLGTEPEDAPLLKVCGLTTGDDARLAFAAGAGLLGVIFAASPRRVTPEQAAAVRAAVPEARLCGVFRDEDPARVASLARACGLDLIQLHGAESPAECRRLREATGLPVIKALETGGDLAARAAAYDTAYLLLDRPKSASSPGAPPVAGGGVDPGLLAAARDLAAAGRAVLVAGGLDPTNVKEVMTVAPAGVDVCRGVESAPGHKDPDLLRAFTQEVYE
jgi:indole-3-glycerol phosphate synthase/phosphoribosylanthranilate isomerase